jgi:hypothetical protein
LRKITVRALRVQTRNVELLGTGFFDHMDFVDVRYLGIKSSLPCTNRFVSQGNAVRVSRTRESMRGVFAPNLSRCVKNTQGHVEFVCGACLNFVPSFCTQA